MEARVLGGVGGLSMPMLGSDGTSVTSDVGSITSSDVGGDGGANNQGCTDQRRALGFRVGKVDSLQTGKAWCA